MFATEGSLNMEKGWLLRTSPSDTNAGQERGAGEMLQKGESLQQDKSKDTVTVTTQGL